MRDMSESPPRRFGFDQLRFVIAVFLLVAAGLKAHQLATMPLPPVVQNSVFTPLLELLNDRHIQMAVVVGEILFALILIAGLAKSWMWLLSLLGFSAFTLISLMKAIGGEGSCGCFGVVTVNPWITATFDAVIVGLLLAFREKVDWSFPQLDKKKVLAILLTWLLLAALATYWMLSLKQQPHATLGTVFTGLDGRMTILLVPEDWIGEEFPLISRFAQPEGAENLLLGTWNILLVQYGCPECPPMVAELERTKPENVAIVVIPSTIGEYVPSASFPTFELDRNNAWLVNTPIVIKLSDGICVAFGSEVDD